MSQSKPDILRLSAMIVAAHAQHNSVHLTGLLDAIHNVYKTLHHLSSDLIQSRVVVNGCSAHHSHHGEDYSAVHGEHDENAYLHPEYGQTVFEDRLVCMEDGMSLKMLKRHLQAVHGITPEEYRRKWRLPDDYPMVAPQYAQLRSNLALESGLGLKRQSRTVQSRRGKRKK